VPTIGVGMQNSSALSGHGQPARRNERQAASALTWANHTARESTLARCSRTGVRDIHQRSEALDCDDADSGHFGVTCVNERRDDSARTLELLHFLYMQDSEARAGLACGRSVTSPTTGALSRASQ
jgi:hypothetical protein